MTRPSRFRLLPGSSSAPWIAALSVILLALGALTGCSAADPGLDTGTAPAPTAAERPTRLVLVSWDGGADWVVDRFLAEGRLPHLAALAERGVRAEHSRTCFPSKTAPGHATVWTGAWPGQHGITANTVPLLPRGEHTVLESIRGFDARALLAEPLYVTAARAGRRVVVLSATQSYPPDPWVARLDEAGLPAETLRTVSGFEHRIAPGRLLGPEDLTALAPDSPEARAWGAPAGSTGLREAAFEVGDETFFALLLPAGGRGPAEEGAEVWIRQGSRRADEALAEARLVPREAETLAEAPVTLPPLNARPDGWSEPFEVRGGQLPDGSPRVGGALFRLFEASPDGAAFALYQREVHGLDGTLARLSSEDEQGDDEAELDAYRRAYPGFHDDPFYRYRSGGLGTPIPLGGDGRAERRVLEIVAHDLALAAAGSRFAFDAWDPDLLFHYTPMTDSAGHVWMGALDPESPAHDPETAERLWPYYRRVFELQDAWLGQLVEAAGPNAIVALVSDHGMTGIGRHFHTNRALARAGLLTLGPDGTPNLARTKAVAVFPELGVRFNTTDWKEGIVPEEDREALFDQVARALRAVIDPETGEPPITRIIRPEEIPGGPGPRTADLYFDLAPGYYPQERPLENAATEPVVTPSRSPWGEGHHGYWPERRDMHAIFYAAGPGLPSGVDLGPVEHVDIAPMLAGVVGLRLIHPQ